MDSVLDLFLGDPVYDENKRVVRRNFGIKNILVICFTLYALYYFLPKTTILSGMIPKSSKGSKKGNIQKGGSLKKILLTLLIIGLIGGAYKTCSDESWTWCVIFWICLAFVFVGIIIEKTTI